MKIRTIILLAIFVIGIIISCKKDPTVEPTIEPPPTTNSYTSSWDLIQKKIFAPNCVECHTAGNTFANQSGLVLTEDVAYQNLIGKRPTNLTAAADGLFLLEQTGLNSLYTSFLWEKINAPDQEHFYQDHPEYGEQMPLGNESLTNGELEYIRQWILAGAPETGFVGEESILDDTSVFQAPDENFEPLPLPDMGYQMHLGPFDVKPDFEREVYQYKEIGNTEDIFVNRYEIRMRKGSHHFILYDFENGAQTPDDDRIRDLRFPGNGQYDFFTLWSIENQVYVFGTQFRETDFTYPEGVAKRIPANKSLDMNTHYVNYGTEPVKAEVYVNLHTIDEIEVEHISEELFLSNENFELPPNQRTTVNANYTFDERRNVFMLTSHAHQTMEEFRIFIKGGPRDGELIYFTNDWEHPILMQYDPPIVLNRGEGLRSETIYNNESDEMLDFGPLSTDEMNIIFGSYYTD